MPPGGKREGGSAGEGDGEDMDVDENDQEEDEEVWEEIPGYLPPLPKPKEKIGLYVGK